MLPEPIREKLENHIRAVAHPRELAIDVMNELQAHYGYFSDEAVEQASKLLGMTENSSLACSRRYRRRGDFEARINLEFLTGFFMKTN